MKHILLIYLFVYSNLIFCQEGFYLNPKSYIVQEKLNKRISSIKEIQYSSISEKDKIKSDTSIFIDNKEYNLKVNSYSNSVFKNNQKIETHYDKDGTAKFIWTYKYDDNGNILCSIFNRKDRENKDDNWSNIDKGLKYCYLYDNKERIIRITSKHGVNSIQNYLIVYFRGDGLISKIYLSDPWGDLYQVFQAFDIGDTIRYKQSFEFVKGKENPKDQDIFNKFPEEYIDLIKDENGYYFYHKVVNDKLKSVRLVEKFSFDKLWRKKEVIEYKNDTVNYHKIYHYNKRNQIVEIKNLMDNSLSVFKYDKNGNKIYVDNNYLLMYYRYDKFNNLIMSYKFFKKNIELKELSLYEIKYKK